MDQQRIPFHDERKCPSCGNMVVLDGVVDVPIIEEKVVVPKVIAPPIKAEWLKPSYDIKVYTVTTADLLEYLRIQIQLEIPNANVAGVSLVLGDPRNYNASNQFTELLIGVSGALNDDIHYTWAQKDIVDASGEVYETTPLNPLLAPYMFDINYLQAYIRKGDYQRRIRLQKKLGIGDDALKKLMNDSRPQIADTANGPIILVSLDVEKIMLNLFATQTEKIPEMVQVMDANGCPVIKDGKPVFEVKRDSKGNIVYTPEKVPVYDEDGKPVLDKNGKQVYDVKRNSYGRIIYEEKKVVDAEGRIMLVGITPLSEFEVQYTVYYTLAPAGPGKDNVYVKDYLERRARSRK